MKDGKYEVGDVIAFRWTGKKLREGEMGDSFTFYDRPTQGESIFCNHGHPVQLNGAYILERIDNPKLMEGEWWEGWRWQYIENGEVAPDGSLFLVGSCGRDTSTWSNIKTCSVLSPDPPCGRDGRYALIPPKSSPCPELKAKIEKLEADLNAKSAELAELKKQALGE